MRSRDIIICVICVVVGLSFLGVAGSRLDYINEQRKEMKLISNEPLTNAPPTLAFATVAMGAFRGLVVDILWIRADRLKQEGQFFDAKQLADWITKLQPRFAPVWEFQAWNMAYNISVAIPATDPAERWRWVKNGYELLRDKGIAINPKSMLIYRELARIFQHKIGDFTDDANQYYKLQLAEGIGPLVEGADNAFFDALCEAPLKFEEVSSDANTASFVEALRNADKAFDKKDEFVANYLSLRQNPDRFGEEAGRVIEEFAGSAGLSEFDVFAKAYQLRNVWKLDPELMREINLAYGPVSLEDPNNHHPLDWRHADSHAIYWSIMGLKAGHKEDYNVHEANTDRMVLHSLQNLFQRGKIFIYEVGKEGEDDFAGQYPDMDKAIYLRPDLRMFDSYHKAIKDVADKYDIWNTLDGEGYKVGYRNMLTNALLNFYQAGHEGKAGQIYKELREKFPERGDMKVSLMQFAQNRMVEELKNIGVRDSSEMISALLSRSYFSYAVGDDDEAFAREKMAREIYDLYQSQYFDRPTLRLPGFERLRYLGLLDFFADPQYPRTMKANLLGRLEAQRPDLAEEMKAEEKRYFEEQQSEQGSNEAND